MQTVLASGERDLGYAKLTFQMLLKGRKNLGIDGEMRPVWQDYVDHIREFPTAAYNGKTLFTLADQVNNPVKGNALINKGDQPINLEGIVHPAEYLAIGSDPVQLQIARDTLAYMDPFTPGKQGSTKNGYPKTFTIAARVGWEPEDLITKFKAATKAIWRNNLTAAQSGGGIETSGSIETINSMLLQTNEDVIRVFPD